MVHFRLIFGRLFDIIQLMHRLPFILLLCLSPSLAAQQPQFTPQAPLPAAEARVLSAPSTVQRELTQIEVLADAQAWDEAVDAMLRLMDDSSHELVAIAEGYHLPLAMVCQVRISRWPAEGLAAYRQRVDGAARGMLNSAAAKRDAAKLWQVIQTYYASSVADEALLALADMSLETGDTNTARSCLLQISPATCAADGRPWGVALAGVDLSQAEATRAITEQITSPKVAAAIRVLVYPDTNLPLADILARLAVVSIRQRSFDRAERELAVLKLAFPEAEGRIAGRNSNLAQAVADVLAAARDWPAPKLASNWPTGSGSAAGGVAAAAVCDVYRTVWRRDLPTQPVQLAPPQTEVWLGRRLRLSPVASARRISSFVQPLVSENAVVFQAAGIDSDISSTGSEWLALDRTTGKPLFGERGVVGERRAPANDSPETAPGVLQLANPARRPVVIGDARVQMQFQIQVNQGPVVIRGNPFALGGNINQWMPARETRSQALLAGDLFYQVNEAQGATPQGARVLARDLAAEGKLRLEIVAGDGERFTGPPVILDDRIYLPVQETNSSGRLAVACYSPTSGRRLWRTPIASIAANADRPADVLIAGGGRLYLSTDAGVVVALHAADGKVAWARTYDRGRSQRPNDLSQVAAVKHGACLLTDGALVCAPADCAAMFAIDPATGQLLWTNAQAWNVEYFLGVSEGRLVATGKQLWMIDPVTGATQFVWPDTLGAGAAGSGRGCVAGNELFWPTEKAIYAFDLETARQTRSPIDLKQLGGTGGASVTPCGDGLLVATGLRLTLLGDKQRTAPASPGGSQSPDEAKPDTPVLGDRGDNHRLFAVE